MADSGGSDGRTPTPANYARNFNGGTLSPAAASTPNGSMSQQRIAGLGMTSRKPTARPTALYSSSTWSANHDSPNKSATVPPPQEWESLKTSQPKLTHVSSASPLRSEYAAGPHGSENSKPGIKTVPSLPSIHYTQTAQYHSSNKPSPLSQVTNDVRHTESIPQHPWAPYSASTSSTSSASGHHLTAPTTASSTMPPLRTQPQKKHAPTEEPMSPGNSSVAISDHYTVTHPEKAGHKGEVWFERQHPRGLRRALKEVDSLEWTEAWPGALKTLSALNAEQFQMPWGTRVINVKTDFPQNIVSAIRFGKVAKMAANAERTMALWNARQSASEKVFFMFSVNSSGRFCGIAEMSGPWDKDDSIDGWQSHSNNDAPTGTFPVTWLFVKDIAYHQFKQIRQNNGKSVGNMWNGMAFPQDVARRVVELYVKCPATTSIIAHPNHQNEGQALIAYMPNPNMNNHYQQRGDNYMSRGRGGGRGGYRGAPPGNRQGPPMSATDNQNWRGRAESNPWSGTSTSNSLSTDAKVPDEHWLEAGHTIPAGSVFCVKMNEHGKLALCAVREPEQGNQFAANETAFCGQLAEYNATRARDINSTAYGARSLNSAGRPSTTASSALQSNTDVSTSATSTHFPAVSMAQSLAQGTDSRLGNLPAYTRDSYAVQPPHIMGSHPQQYGNHSGMQYLPEQTPTHGPVSHGTMNMAPPDLPTSQMSITTLQVEFHNIAAEIFALQDALQNQKSIDASTHILKEMCNRALIAKQQVKNQLLMMGVSNIESLSPFRRDSFTFTDGDATSGSISPVRAEDGRALKSASKVGSPGHTSNFDRAPGGSARQNYGHAYKASSSDHIKKSINELLDSNENTPVRGHPDPRSSGFFQPANNFGSAINFPAPVEQRGANTYAQQSHGFNSAPMQPHHVGGQANFAHGNQSHGFSGGAMQPSHAVRPVQMTFGQQSYEFNGDPFQPSNGSVSAPFASGQQSQSFNGAPTQPNSGGNQGASASSSFPSAPGSAQKSLAGGVSLDA